jgi:hypothetical protein
MPAWRRAAPASRPALGARPSTAGMVAHDARVKPGEPDEALHHQALVSPSGGYHLITPALGRPNFTRTGGRAGFPGVVALVVFVVIAGSRVLRRTATMT